MEIGDADIEEGVEEELRPDDSQIEFVGRLVIPRTRSRHSALRYLL